MDIENKKLLEAKYQNELLNRVAIMKKELKYNPTRYVQLISTHGAVKATKMLLASNNISYGFTELSINERLDLSCEATMLEEPFSALFTKEGIELSRKKLKERGYFK